MEHEANFDLNFGRFKTVNTKEKQEIIRNSKAENTNKATELWMNCFTEYLEEKSLPKVTDITNIELPKILSDFYVEVKKKDRVTSAKTKAKKKLTTAKSSKTEEYKNSSLMCIRAALNRYFRRERGLDIISNQSFIQANEMFKGVTKVGRKQGRGSVDHKNAISDEDFEKLSHYFTTNIQGPPNAKFLQDLILFNIIYYMGRRGRENLRQMKKDTFQISTDGDSRRYIHQVIDEYDKNHTESNLEPANEARIYEHPGARSIQFQ